jgi:hypothetical protein
MMTNLAGSPPLDILVRSSGVKRLSDFLMWQVRFFSGDRTDRSRCSWGRFSAFAGIGKRPASFQPYVLARFWVLGPFPCYSGVSGKGVESTRRGWGTECWLSFGAGCITVESEHIPLVTLIGLLANPSATPFPSTTPRTSSPYKKKLQVPPP